MEQKRDIVLEASTKRDFIEELAEVPGGERIRDCIQCGTCSGSCPVSYFMDNTPRKLIAMIRAGMRDMVLDSASLWLCTSCYTCTVRCPQKIAITDIIYALKRLAMKEQRKAGATKAAALAKTFVKVVNARGRNFEPSLLISYYLKTNPAGLLGKAPLGMKLMGRGRFPLSVAKVKGKDQIQAIVAKVEELGGI